MSIQKIREKLHFALINEGIYVDDDDMMISEYLPDSLAFVSLIVQIECQLDIELPDEIINWKKLGSVNSLTLYLNELIRTNSAPNSGTAQIESVGKGNL